MLQAIYQSSDGPASMALFAAIGYATLGAISGTTILVPNC